MARTKTTTKTTGTTEQKPKRIAKKVRFIGGGGATVTIYLRQGKGADGGFNVGASLREPNEKPKTGCPAHEQTLEQAQATFEAIVAVAQNAGWQPRAIRRREPKPPAFTIETFPAAKPIEASAQLAFPKKASKKTTKK